MEYECGLCETVRFTSMIEMRRHVAINHAKGVFSTFRCGHCHEKFYDCSHFMEHAGSDSACAPISMNEETLTELQAKMFTSLVEQTAKQVATSDAQPPPTPTVSVGVMEVDATSLTDRKSDVEFIDLVDGDDPGSKNDTTTETAAPHPPNKNSVVSASTTIKAESGNDRETSKSQREDKASLSTTPVKKNVEKIEKHDVKPATGKVAPKGKKGRKKAKALWVRRSKRQQSKHQQAPTILSHSYSNSSSDDEENSGEKVECAKTLLDLCQLCVELQNDRPPMFSLEEKESHAMIHLRFAPNFAAMTDSQMRLRPEFGKVMKMCFQEGFYEQLKEQEQGER